eukprot:CAMPEP_0119341272 /NCGR_PEP_ID=MMETSP1333-20130426/102000_1 /TAXON_ID=418940 /ORGANISM="Scyphosphaera apsteinii, Strain RCC1455" /LENGTH=65 /DNA_ID=CAMNT_0007353197 /DNA_START=7 /DNA_END=201 /DNA_ORIENTATION=+
MTGWHDLNITVGTGISRIHLPPHDANHMLPMAGMFARGWRLNGIGHLEEIQQDWQHILNASGIFK